MKTTYIAALLALGLVACKTPQPVANNTTETATTVETAGGTVILKERPNYMASRTHKTDLLHTKLEVDFDWKYSRLNGKATLDFKPWFYPTDSLILDAKGFDVKEVALMKNGAKKVLPSAYDGKKIRVKLDKVYHRTDTFQIYVEYTAKPNELEFGGSSAIASDRGLYFIDPKNEDPNKRRQLWTQGETEASSCWFPTIDAPNEKMTQEIYITVAKEFTTLSNGLLIFSTENGDGTRTDYWKQSIPHTPYLTMMTVGEFVEVKQMWRDSIEVSYFVEPEWEKYAIDIFGETPEMMEFFSTKLGVDYPWEKYAQVVVRDYVSGAMENTTATIHGDFLYRNKRELLDEHNEGIIAHELFHHWFGDLVTCESWANLPLNESFATYSEYLWAEYKHGRDAADDILHSELSSYLNEAGEKQVDMIRYDHTHPDDMFDSHSYAKGGRILHMLRKYVGDDAFFESLKLYLNDNRFEAAEIHHLRLAFEEVTGEDLNWFFDQWFLASGHPSLQISHLYDATNKQQIVMVSQEQNLKTTPLYKLPIEIDIYAGGEIIKYKVTIDSKADTFRFSAPIRPDLVNVDAEKMLLAQKFENKPTEWWAFQYRHAPLYLDRYEALLKLKRDKSDLANTIMMEALNDKDWHIRIEAILSLKKVKESNPDAVRTKLINMSKTDENANVRKTAIANLYNYFSRDRSIQPEFMQAMTDSSYGVQAAGLVGLYKLDYRRGVEEAIKFENADSYVLVTAVASIYAEEGTKNKREWFETQMNKISDSYDGDLYYFYAQWLKGQKEDTFKEGLKFLAHRARTTIPYWMKFDGYFALADIQASLNADAKTLRRKIDQAETEGNTDQVMELKQSENKLKSISEYVANIIEDLLAEEKDPTVLRKFGR